MNNMPQAQVYQDTNTYENVFLYMPWGSLISEVLTAIEKTVPHNGSLIDIMCGPGYLLGKIQQRRIDIKLQGIDSSEEFIAHAKSKYSHIGFTLADVLLWECSEKFDAILITGGTHHIAYNQQSSLLKKVSSLLKDDGIAIIADPYINDYVNETERKIAAAKLGYEYLLATIHKNTPDDIIKAAIDILACDVQGLEYKTSIKNITPLFNNHFSNIEIHKTRPNTESEYGDYYFICKK